jgi:signal transduction histidine kinase/DNA-binding response OmpR family regulator
MTASDKINILVVDDMPDKLLAMQAILEELGQNIVTVSSGREALRQLLDQEFAVILLDVNMPDIDGFETAALIRRRKKTEHTPIIFVTSYHDEAHAWQGYSLGAVDYILAPVVPEVLRTKVGVFVDLYRKSQLIKLQAEERISLAREQAARVAAESLSERTAFLADASNQLARSLDYDDTASTIMQLVLPKLADIAGLLLLEKYSEYQQCEMFRFSVGGIARSSVRQDGLPAPLKFAIEQALRSGKTTSIDSVEFLGPCAVECRGSRTALPTLAEADPGVTHKLVDDSRPSVCLTVTVLPLIARGRTLGILWIGQQQAADKPDVSLAESLANRAALAIDNARLYGEIQEGDRRKDEFLAMLGHELRNPLAAISNALECLRLAQGNDALQREARAVLERQTQQMSRLVDDLLDVSRITRGKVELRKQLVDLTSIIERAVATTTSAIAARTHQLTVTAPAPPLPLFADPTRLEQVLANLINNAVKYTPPRGQIALTVELDEGDYVVRVVDNGIGIPDHLLPRVFDLFTQGDRSLDRAQGGLGIGLTLVRRLVDLHGGTVAVKSPGQGQGTEFIVRLPQAKSVDSADQSLNGPQVDLPPHPIGKRILLVDDNADLTLTTSALLRAANHEVRVAADGFAALEMAVAWQPDAVLIDIGLPGIDGYEVARRLRELPGWEESLLVAMTGYGQEQDRHRAKQAGFDHHLVKPVDFAVLQKVLAGHTAEELIRT